MAQYNHFGLTYDDVARAFNGAVLSDFDTSTPRTTGGGVEQIEYEMDMAESEVLQKLSRKAISLLDKIEYMEIPQISGSQWTAFPPVLQDFYVYQVSRYNPALQDNVLTVNQYSTICNSTTNDCPNIKKELDYSYLFTDYTRNGDVVTFGPTFNQDRNTYYVSYTVDASRTNLPSIAGILRNRVACVLGMQLYSRQEDTWKLVDLYCNRADASLANIDEHFIPSEYRKYKFLNNPFTVKGGISTIRVGRG